MENTLRNHAPDTQASISLRERFAYGLGNTASCVVYTLITSLLVFFYTDYIGISAGVVGTIMLISRCFDGGSDIIMGYITDHTHSRHGKARAWLLWMLIPYGVTCVALFLIPANASHLFQYVYIFITYNLVNTVVYTAMNLPYGTLSAMMTRDQHEREKINVMRMALGPVGTILISSCTLPLVKHFGDNQRAWILTISLFMVFGMVCLLLCFLGTKERVQIEANTKSQIPFKTSLRALFSNKYWALAMGLWGMQGVYLTFNGTNLPYYCEYILGNKVLSSGISMVENLVQIAFILLMPWFLHRFGKRNMALVGAFIAIAGQIPVILVPTSYAAAMASAVFRGIGAAPLFAAIFSFIADSVEYGQWKSHLRIEGMIFSAASVGAKLGGGLASAIIGKILDTAGYNGLAAMQSTAATHAILNMYMWGPVIIWLIAVALLIFYKLDKQYPSIMEELHERETRGEL